MSQKVIINEKENFTEISVIEDLSFQDLSTLSEEEGKIINARLYKEGIPKHKIMQKEVLSKDRKVLKKTIRVTKHEKGIELNVVELLLDLSIEEKVAIINADGEVSLFLLLHDKLGSTFDLKVYSNTSGKYGNQLEFDDESNKIFQTIRKDVLSDMDFVSFLARKDELKKWKH